MRYLVEAIEITMPRKTWIGELEKVCVVARGPKPNAALRELVRVDLLVPAPNTWHETLALLDEQHPVAGLRVAVQEYGGPNPDLVEGLERRGASVTRVHVYRWELPEDLEPLHSAIVQIAQGRVGIALFTSSQQVEHLLSVAAAAGREGDLRAALGTHTVVGSIGPTTSETLRARGLPVDIEPVHPKLGHLIAAVVARWREVGKTAVP